MWLKQNAVSHDAMLLCSLGIGVKKFRSNAEMHATIRIATMAMLLGVCNINLFDTILRRCWNNLQSCVEK